VFAGKLRLKAIIKIRHVCSATALLLFWFCFYVQVRVPILHISQKEKCIYCHREW